MAVIYPRGDDEPVDDVYACSCFDEDDNRWQDHTRFPCTDDHTRLLIEDALATLLILRAPARLRDAAARVSCLLSLSDQASGLLDDAVVDARELGYSWEEIADRLFVSASTARRRYAGYARWRKAGCPLR